MRFSSFAVPFGLALSLATVSQSAMAASGSPLLLTADQTQVDRTAIALLADPQIKAARETVFKAWTALPAFASQDGKATLAGAVDELVYFSVRSAVEKGRGVPAVVWALSPQHKLGTLDVPGSRWGIDLPDRIYRSAAVDPAGRYVLRGKRSAQPSNDDFLFEVADAGLKTISDLPAKNIDVAADGTFAVTVDATPANGRRNHLTLPAGATSLLIRDTLADWNAQLPNTLTIERVGGPGQQAAPDAVRQNAISLIERLAAFDSQIFGRIAAAPANQVVATVRGLDSGVAGAIIGTGRFSLAADEALVLTVDPQGAGYTNVQLTDPWARSLRSWDAISSLSNRQARPNADGTITFIVSARDPGYHNWLDTTGQRDGIVALRIEKTVKPDAATVVRRAQVVKLTALAAALPADAARITPAERASQLADRKAGFARRLHR